MAEEQHDEVRLRAGVFPAIQLAAATVAILATGYVGVSMVRLLIGQWDSTPGLAKVAAALFAVVDAALMVFLLRRWLAALVGLRPLVVTPGPDGELSLPRLTGWRLGRDQVRLVDVRGFDLTLDRTPRAVRYRLVVHADQGTWVTDSVTSMDLRRGGLQCSRAQRIRDELAAYAVGSRS